MAGLTKTQINALIAKINTQLNTILDSPEKYIKYKVGDKEFDKKGMVDWLMGMLNTLTLQLKKIPAESIDSAEVRTSVFGQDMSEYIGDILE